MKLTEFIGITTKNLHVKFEAVWRSSNFWRKNAYSAGPSKLDEILTFFLNVLQNSWNLQNLLESPPETCMWNLRQFGEVTIFDGKMPTAPDLQNWMKFRHFLNVLQNSWNLQKLLESPPETCMWNLRQFGEVTIFDGKMPTAPFKIGWNFDIFSMFSKIHETYRIYWNHHQKHACEIWGSLEKLQFLTEKCLQRRLTTGWNLDIFSMFSKIHDTYRSYWNHHQKHACEIWGSSEKFQFLMENADSAGPSKQDEILTFSQCSPKFMTLTEFIEITTRNMHVKFEAVWRSYNFWQKNAHSAGPSKQGEILRFSQCSPKFMKLTEFIGITTRNMHVKF